MVKPPSRFVFSQVPSTLAKEAFNFHQSASADNSHIWPRTDNEIRGFSECGELFGVRNTSTGEFVGLCYVTLNENEWELGGLIVSESARGLGLGTVLVSFAVALTIASQRPWFYGQKLIAMVHEANKKPRNVLRRVGFEQLGIEQGGKVEVPDGVAPASMIRNSAGKLVGDKFVFPRENVKSLAVWFNIEFKGVLSDGKSLAVFEVKPGGIDSVKESLQEAVNELYQ